MPRAVGKRRDYIDLPPDLRAWVEATVAAPVYTPRTQVGGMSPGCAARLFLADGRTVFLKAVGAGLNPDTPALFRREIDVLGRLPDVPYRSRLLASYDDDDWVALLLEDVDGRFPDLCDPDESEAVWATALRQTRELTPAPGGLHLPTLADTMDRWLLRWADIMEEPERYLPGWAVPVADGLHARVEHLGSRLPVESLCHFDLRDDNILVRADGTVVVLDWGMARFGPHWADLFFLATSWADDEQFDRRLAGLDVNDDDVTDLLLHFAAAQSWRAEQPAPPGLPTLPAFCRGESDRMFAGVKRRLNHSG